MFDRFMRKANGQVRSSSGKHKVSIVSVRARLGICLLLQTLGKDIQNVLFEERRGEADVTSEPSRRTGAAKWVVAAIHLETSMCGGFFICLFSELMRSR
jgi:hypothetical protein